MAQRRDSRGRFAGSGGAKTGLIKGRQRNTAKRSGSAVIRNITSTQREINSAGSYTVAGVKFQGGKMTQAATGRPIGAASARAAISRRTKTSLAKQSKAFQRMTPAQRKKIMPSHRKFIGMKGL